MRLEFNMVLVDDEWEDEDANDDIKELMEALEEVVRNKGFEPKTWFYKDPSKFDASFDKNNGRRVDLYISDNNLGMVDERSSSDGGIEFYLKLKKTYLCDFILYTRSDKKGIIGKLVEDLQREQDPNLFSRLTFVSRHDGGTGWHLPIIKVIEHMLTKREEINNLRGLYAQLTAEMENHLRTRIESKTPGQNLSGLQFCEIIDHAAREEIIDSELKQWLHNQRLIRNGIIHNNEEFCDKKKSWFVTYKIKNRTRLVFEADFVDIREKLKSTYAKVMAL